MATHSSVLAWRIPGTGEPGGLPSMGSHRVGHNWSNSAAAVAATVLTLSYFSISMHIYTWNNRFFFLLSLICVHYTSNPKWCTFLKIYKGLKGQTPLNCVLCTAFWQFSAAVSNSSFCWVFWLLLYVTPRMWVHWKLKRKLRNPFHYLSLFSLLHLWSLVGRALV